MRTFSLSFLGTCGLLAAAACDDDSVATPQLDDTCGTFRVETAAELAELTHCRTIDELVVVSSEITAVELPKLERVGYFLVNSPSIERVELPALVGAGALWLESADGPALQVSLPELTTLRAVSIFGAASATLDAPRLETVDSDLRLEDVSPVVSLPRLATIGGMLTLSGPELEELLLPVLETLGGLELRDVGLTTLQFAVPELDTLTVEDCAALTSVDLPDLAQAGDITIARSPALKEVLVPQLTDAETILLDTNLELASFSADALVHADDVSVLQNPALEALALPSLLEVPLSSEQFDVGAGVKIVDNAGLKTVLLPSLERAPSLDLIGNTALALVDLDALSEVGDLDAEGVVYGGVDVEECAALTDLSLPSLRTSSVVYVRSNASLAQVRAPLLETGFVTIEESPALQTLEFEALREGSVNVGACAVSELSLPSFEFGQLFVGIGPSLSSLSAPAFLEGDLSVADAPTALSFPSLAYSERIEVLQSERLESLSLPALKYVNELFLTGCPALASLSLPQLSDLGLLDVNGTGLANLSLPELSSLFVGLQLSNNASLMNLDLGDFGANGSACNLQISGNPSLPTCEVQALLDAALAKGANCAADVADTDDAAVCN
jgi:hypothetical protein